MSDASTCKRKAVKKGVRFDVFKRDGFKCRYCGGTPNTTNLVIDHVVPVSKGGTNDPENLYTSCQTCNSGKAAKELGDRLPAPPLTEDVLEQVAQMEAYKDSVVLLMTARDDLLNIVIDHWHEAIGAMRDDTIPVLRSFVRKHDLAMLIHAIDVTGSRFPTAKTNYEARSRAKYFCGVIRREMEAEE